MDFSRPSASPLIGYVGLGAMGGGMSRNLLNAGYRLICYDIRPEAVAACVAAGAEAGEDAGDVVRRTELVMTSLVGDVYPRVAEEALLPNACQGQAFVDHSTVPAPETRRLAAAFAAKGAVAIDAPVSGWYTGAAAGTLAVFIGGDRATVDACRPLFEVIGNPDRIIYGGPAGMGQVMKVVQQLQNRLLDAARMEAMAFGVRGGLSLEEVLHVLNVDPAGDDGYAGLYRRIVAGESDQVSLLYGEWAYYLAEATQKGIPMPVLESLYAFCEPAERVSHDEQGRPTPDLWRELMDRCGPALRGNQ